MIKYINNKLYNWLLYIKKNKTKIVKQLLTNIKLGKV